MNFKEKLMAVFELLHLKQKVEAGTALTQEEFQAVVAEYQKKYQTTLKDDLDAAQQSKLNEEQQAEMQAMLNSIQQVLNTINPAATPEQTEKQDASLASILESLNGIREDFKALAGKPTPDKPEQTVTLSPLAINGFGNTPEYLFGVQHPMFSMKNRWNKIAANPRAASALPEVDEQVDGVAFHKAACAYAKSLKERYQYLQENKMLDAPALATGKYATNYGGVDGAGLGDQFVLLRQDAIIARVLEKRDLTQHFPVQYGIQDRALIFNAFFDEVSQAYQAGEIFKGGMKIENQMGYVDDAMIKIEWGPMKELERKYIAYLNKEGSDPIKWTMIEYQLLNTLLGAQTEQSKRRMRGIYVKPEQGTAGSYLNAGTGLLYTLLRYVHQYDICLPHLHAGHHAHRRTGIRCRRAGQRNRRHGPRPSLPVP